MNSGDSSPCNCTAVRETCSRMARMCSGDSFTKTPTRSMFPGSWTEISRARSGKMRRALGAKMNPSASAPAETEVRASSTDVVPQILIQVGMMLFGGKGPQLMDCSTPGGGTRGELREGACFLQQPLEPLSGILGAHEDLAN